LRLPAGLSSLCPSSSFGQTTVTHYISEDVLIKNIDDALDIIGNSKVDNLIFHEHNFEKDFFDLSTRKLGDILQKFTNYRIKIAILGQFVGYSENFTAFVRESNKHGHYFFVSSIEEVEKKWRS
jgi:hypothetical protein